MMGLPVRLGVLRGLATEISASANDARPLVVGGALADVLQRELARGGDARAVRVGDPEGGALYVHVLGREQTERDEQAIKRARRARLPIVAVAEGTGPLAFVLATDVVPLRAGSGFPVDAIAERIAAKLGEDGTALAARLPVLRGPVCEQLIAAFARRNGILAAAVFVPGADLPVLALNQLRLVLRLAAAHGETIDRERLPEVLGTIGAGLGFRVVARELVGVAPKARWAVQGAVAYAGTRALGEAALKWFGSGDPVGDGATPRPGEASPAAP